MVRSVLAEVQNAVKQGAAVNPVVAALDVVSSGGARIKIKNTFSFLDFIHHVNIV